MANETNQNVAILALMAALKDNSKELTAQTKKMVSKVEENAGTINFGANTEEIQEALKKINKLIGKELKGIDLTKYFAPLLKVFSDAESSTEDYLSTLQKVEKELGKISSLTSTTRGLMQSLSPKDLQKVLSEYDKLIKKQEKYNDAVKKAQERASKISGSSTLSLVRQYKDNEDYQKLTSTESLDNLINTIGVKNKGEAKQTTKEYLYLISLFDILQKEKKELSEINTSGSASREIEINKSLLNLYDEIEKREKRLSSAFGAKNLLSSTLEQYDKGELQYAALQSQTKYVELSTADLKLPKKAINAQIEEMVSEIVRNSANKMLAEAEKVSAEAKSKLERYNQESNKGTATGSSTDDSISQIGDSSKEASKNVQELDASLDAISNVSESNGLDLWEKSAGNLKEEFADIIKYAVDAETALKKVNELNKTLDHRMLSEEETRDLVGFSQRSISLGLELPEEQEETFYDYADDYKKMAADIERMTSKQLTEIEKLKVAQQEVTEQTKQDSSTNMEKQIEETTEAVENLVQAEKKAQEQGEKLNQEFSNEGLVNKEEIEKLTSILGQLQDNSKVKVDVDIQEAIVNTETIREKIDKLPEIKDITIRVHDTDYSNTSLLSDEEGKTVTAFRGVKNAWSGLVNDKGISFFTDQLELAADYADSLAESGKIYSANLSFKNPLEIDGNGAVWNEIEFDGVKRTTDEIVDLAKQLGHDGVIFKNIRDGFGEANGALSNVMVTLNEAQIKNEQVVAAVKAGSGEITEIVKSPLSFFEQESGQLSMFENIKEEQIEVKESVKETNDAIEGQIDLLEYLNSVDSKSSSSNSLLYQYFEQKYPTLPQEDIQNAVDTKKNRIITSITRGNVAMGDGTIGDFIESEEKAIQYAEALEQQLQKIGYTLKNSVYKETGEWSAEIVPIDKNAITDVERMKEILFDINQIKDGANSNKNSTKENTSDIKTETSAIKENTQALEQNVKAQEKQTKSKAKAKEIITNPSQEGFKPPKGWVKDVDSAWNLANQENDRRVGRTTLQSFEDTFNSLSSAEGKINDYKLQLSELEKTINRIREVVPIDITNQNEVEQLEQLKNKARELVKDLNNTQKYDLAETIDINRLSGRISDTINKNTAMPKNIREGLEGLRETLKQTDLSKQAVRELESQFVSLTTQMKETGKTGASMGDKIKKKFGDVAAYFATYVSIQDFIQMLRRGFETINEYDKALTEMNKVSDETISTLKEFQQESFELADAIGATASAVQNSTADWMRLGETLDEAKKSAEATNILFNVSEFESIDAATDSLVSMSQAYKDLEKMDIVDIMNNIGNNYSISTDGLATALQKSASALTTANNDINEAVALITAGNAVAQDPDSVGAGLRTISLRLVGTEAAKKELEALGEEADDVITTTSKLRDVIISATQAASEDGKGFDILDDNGNYKSTYEIMLGLSGLYDDIVKKDKELGTNNLNLLLETIAGEFCLKFVETHFYRTHLIALIA